MKLPIILGKLPIRFQWTLHNMVGHPLMEVLLLAGFEGASITVHDKTVPARWRPIVQKPGQNMG